MTALPSSRVVRRAALAAVVFLAASTASATEWFVSPKGSPDGKGTRDAPWDIASALLGKPVIQPGDSLQLLGGTYRRRPKELFEVHLVGAEGKPIRVRPAPGQRVIIDGGLVVPHPAAHVWFQDLEILVSEPLPEKPVAPGSSPVDLKRPWGGIHTGNDPERGSQHCKFINLVIHGCLQGMSLWSGSRNLEVYGCVIYDNGWRGTDRGHGHGIYTQNREGVLTIADCILSGGFDGTYSIHAYGSKKAYVNHYLVEGNILYKGGPLLIGGGRPSEGIRVRDNCLFGVPLRLGYAAPENLDCEVRGNVVVNAGLNINKFKQVVNKDNLVLEEKAPRPRGARVVLRPNKYDSRRAHLAVFNWDRKPTVAVDAGAFLKSEEGFRLMNPRDVFGKPVLSGTFDGKPIMIPIADEFAAFVLLKEEVK